MNPPEPEVIGPGEVGPDIQRWEKRLADLETEELSKVRAAAEKWAATLTALLGLAGTVLIVRGAEEISGLSDGTKIAIGVLLVIAFVAAVVATVLTAYAAQGTPKNLEWPTAASLREWEHKQAKTAKSRLFHSRWISLVAVLAIAIAVAVAWLGEAAESSGSKVLFTPATGKPLCGSLVNAAGGLELEIGDKHVALPPGPYDNTISVDSCPAEENDPADSSPDGG